MSNKNNIKLKNSEPELETSEKLAQNENNMFDPKRDPPTIAKMAGLFFRLYVPALFTTLMGFLVPIANAVFAGRMNDPTKLAVVGLANVVHAIMVMSFMIGLNSA